MTDTRTTSVLWLVGQQALYILDKLFFVHWTPKIVKAVKYTSCSSLVVADTIEIEGEPDI